MTTLTATEILAENGYTTDDFTAAVTEGIINNAKDYINLMADQSITDMTGTEGSKTLTLTSNQSVCLRILLACMLREAKKTALTNSSATGNSSGTSSSVGVGPISLSESSSISTSISAAASINSPSNTIYREMLNNALERLRGRVFVRTR